MKVCLLTLSEKFGNKCVVAYDYENNKLIRLVSDKYATGIEPQDLCGFNVLDIVNVKRISEAPLECQKENIIIDPNNITKVGEEDISLLERILNATQHQYIFNNLSYKLLNNELDHSIEIIKFKDMIIKENDFKTNKAYFKYKGNDYSNFSITDSNYYNKKNYTIDSGYAIITIPVSDEFTEQWGYFKYIAAIYEIH
jgi:hypothetical protein